MLPGEGDVVEAAGFPGGEPYLTHLAQTLASGPYEDQAGLDADAVMPTADPQPGHQFGIAKPSVRQEADPPQAEGLQHAFDFGQHGKQLGRAYLSAGVFEHMRDEWNRASPKKHGDPNQAELLEQDAGVQGQDQCALAPFAQSASHQGTVNAGRVGGWILQSPTTAAFGALGEGDSGIDVGDPGWAGRAVGEQHACDHPAEGTSVANVVPQATLELREAGLVQSRSVPSGIFSSHQQKVSPTGDAFSYFQALKCFA